MSHDTPKKDDIRKEDYISKFQINEIVPLLRIAEKYNVDISDGKRYLVKALHIARTTKDMDEIVNNLDSSKKETEKALQAHFTRWHSFLRMDIEAKKGMISQDSSLPHLIQTAGVFILDKNYDTAATLLGRCELELLKLVSSPSTTGGATAGPITPPFKPSVKPDTTPSPEVTLKNKDEKEQKPSSLPTQNQEMNIVQNSSSINQPRMKIIEKHPGYQKIVIYELAKCGFCMGKIKPGSVAIECDCGIYYHEQCSIRVAKCSNCGVELSF